MVAVSRTAAHQATTQRSVETERAILKRVLNGHHLLHHRYMHKNFNVVLPLADFFLGTLLLRSPIAFPQARGPAVPDVQPRSLPATQPALNREARVHSAPAPEPVSVD